MQKIKVLFIISNINIGGPQKSLLALLDNIDYDKFDVSIGVLNPGGTLQNYYNKNVTFVDVPEVVTAATLPSKNTEKWLRVLLKNKKYSLYVDSLKSIFNHLVFKSNMNQERQKNWKKHHRDLPRVPGYYDLSFGILGLSTYVVVDLVESNKKFHWIRSDSRILNRDTRIDAEYYKKLNGALSVSKECSEIFIDMYPFMKGKVKVFYNHIPVSFYKSLEYNKSLIQRSNEVVNIITVARLDPLKGIEMAIDACARLIKKGYKIKWFILGDGKFRNEIKKMIRDKKIEESFILLGFQMNTLAFINNADIFVHPSRTEGKSNAVDEAKYIGKPIVVTNYDTVGEQIQHNVTGLICGMSGEEIALAVEKIINDEKLRDKFIKNCKQQPSGIENITEFFSGILV